ncbi:hypothetical protein [Priestia megaterium]|nr:hypothetical protein [Priestia megaterium]
MIDLITQFIDEHFITAIILMVIGFIEVPMLTMALLITLMVLA